MAPLESRGIEVGSRFVTRLFGDFLIGVGRQRVPAAPAPSEASMTALSSRSG